MTTTKKGQFAVAFTNVEKVFFPAVDFSKGDLIDYYVRVAPHILPHLKERPVTLIRFPDGVKGAHFYEKHAPGFAPPWVRTAAIGRSGGGTINYIVINDAATLAWCANLAALELHPFLHHARTPARPTCVAFDLDPGEGADLLTCVRTAFLVRDLLGKLGLETFPKVSGSKGLQLYLPLNTAVTYAATGSFAKAVAGWLASKHPDLVVDRMTRSLRRDRVLIDWSQNSAAKTTVAVYSMRGKREEPFISMPVTWEELRRALKTGRPGALSFSPEAALKRLNSVGDLFEPVLRLKQSLPRGFTSGTPAAEPALHRYRAKRDFAKTHEPAPASPDNGAPASGGRFVIQKHAASHLHYDFRLEMGGTLKSWAVPKGVPTEMGVKRSAIAVEDHPLDYLTFEGTIPKGQYGGGTVMVWDLGTYELVGGSAAEGSLKVVLHGKKLEGSWHLFQIRSERGKDVWLIAKSGEAAKPISARQEDRSVLTQRSMARIAKEGDGGTEPRKR